MQFSKKGRKILSVILLAVLVVTTVFTNFTQKVHAETPAAPAASPDIDYIKDSYNDVGAGHVFDSVTQDRLVRILRNPGKSIVLLGSPENATSQASLKYINEAAKEYGIQKIYLFDPHLGGSYGVDITDTTKAYNSFWNTLKTYTSTNGSLLKYIDSNYTSDSTYLFVYDRNAGGNTAAVDSEGTILSELLITNPVQVTDDTSGFKTAVENVFSSVGGKGSPNETRFSQFDYFKSWTGGTSLVTDAHKEGFRLQEVTYPELIKILETPGTHNILFSGSWCGDSKAAIGYIAENSAKYNSGPVYVFDFRLDGGLTPSSPYWHDAVTYTKGLSVLALETDQYPTGTGYLGAKIIDLLTPYNAGHDNTALSYFPDGNPANLLTTTANIKFRSPFLIQYNKDAKDENESPHPVVKEWIHQLSDYEVPNHTSETGVTGAYVDYELSSGYLTNAQKALGRAGLGTFFSGSPITYTPPKINISESDSEVDSGCGDENDPVNNLGDTKLIPNHGTNSYDVKNYDINIQFDPNKISEKDSFTGNTTITAVAEENLNSISLDFRALHISSVSVKNTTTNNDIVVTSYKQENQDDIDNQKLIINLAAPITASDSFQVNVIYDTGTIDAFSASGQSPQGFSQAINGTGGTAIGEPFGSTYWFPNNNTPSDAATYNITLVAPNTYASVSNGNLISNSNNTPSTGLRTRVWKVTQETAPYQIFASFSNDYLELTQTITLTDGRTINAYSYVNKTIYNANENRNRDKVDTFYNKLPYYIRQIEAIAGSYPGESAGFVFDDLSNGAGISSSWGAVETKDRPFFTNSGITGENTFVHEYVHQWFGNSIRIADWNQLWLNEGFATYVTDLFYENTQGASAYEKYKKLFTETNASSNLWKTAPADIKRETDLFGGAKVAYNRGALALAALRATIGDDDFFTLLKKWTSEKAGQAATTAQFIDLAEEVTGDNLDTFFQTWLYGTTKPAAFPTPYGISLSQADTYNFPSAAVNYGTQSGHTVTVNNGGTQATGELDVTLSGADSDSFTLSKSKINNIEAKGNDSFTIQPKTGLGAGTYTASVAVSGSNGISASFHVSFTVNDIIPAYGISISPSGTKTFAEAAAGYPAQAAYNVTVSNTGNQETGALSITLSGENSSSFSLSKNSISSLAVDGKETFAVQPVTGLSEGSYTATVEITGNNGIYSSFNVNFKVNAVVTKPIVYPVLNSFAAVTGSGDISTRIDADYTKFVKLIYNNQVVDPSNYTVTSGSTIITLKESYLKTLANGTYNFVAEFTDGTAALTLTVDVKPGSNDTNPELPAAFSPQTGDGNNISFMILLGLVSILIISGVSLSLIRNRKTKINN